MAKHHTFRLNDMCSVVPKRNAFGPQQGEHVIIIGRHHDLNEYTIYYKDGLYGWFKAEDLSLVQHDAHEQLELWEDAYNERCALAAEQDAQELRELRELDEVDEKLDRIDNGHCSECNKKLDPDVDDEYMCLSCRMDSDDEEAVEETYDYHVVDPRMRVLFKTNDFEAAEKYASESGRLCKVQYVGE